MAIEKKIIPDRPKSGNISQYNFDDGYSTTPPNYNDSISLPKNNDKFQNKDLYTKAVGDKVNDSIILKNLFFAGKSSIRIEDLYISNTGVSGTTIDNNVSAWIFTEAAYGGDPTQDGHGTISSKLKDEFKFYSENFGDRSEGSDIGNISNVQSTPIIENFAAGATPIIGAFNGRASQFTIDDGLDDDDVPSNIAAFQLSDIPEDNLLTNLFNEVQYNPLYIVIYTKGDKKMAWPINVDGRKTKFSVFKINNADFFQIGEGGNAGKVYQANFTEPTVTRTAGGGASYGATQAAWRVSSLRITINTSAGVLNNFSEAGNYQAEIDLTLPTIETNENIFDSATWLGSIHPRMQLSNNQPSEYANTTLGKGYYRHPDFIPFTTFGYSQNNQLGNDYVDLQSYNYNMELVPKTSIPLNVTFELDIRGTGDGNPLPHYYSYDSYSNLIDFEDASDFPIGNAGDQLFFYFVIDWDDKDDEIQTIEDWLQSKPTNTYDYLNKQNENLYKVKKINYTKGTNNGLLSNVYTTPGIKTVKFIIFSVFDGNGQNNWSPDFEIGRWKLCTSRFYLDIPINQYPDFSVVGGSDYTTLPWPYTTPIIGGVAEKSKYKTSIQDTLSGGKIGDVDIIDEKFLINDTENSEMGKNIEQMDLEQCRYFNKPYGIYDLLNIDAVINNELIPFNDFYYDGETNKFSEESSVGQIFISDNQDLDLKQSCKLELNTGQLTGKSIVDSSGNSNKGLLIGDYKVKKNKKGQPMQRDSFIKVPKKISRNGAL